MGRGHKGDPDQMILHKWNVWDASAWVDAARKSLKIVLSISAPSSPLFT